MGLGPDEYQEVLQLHRARRIAADQAAKRLVACVRNLLPEQSRNDRDSVVAACRQIVDSVVTTEMP